MLNDPRILILDEPMAGLDLRERVRFRNLIHSLARDRIVIFSTHIVSDIETIAGQIIMIRDHRLYSIWLPVSLDLLPHGQRWFAAADAHFLQKEVLFFGGPALTSKGSL